MFLFYEVPLYRFLFLQFLFSCLFYCFLFNLSVIWFLSYFLSYFLFFLTLFFSHFLCLLHFFCTVFSFVVCFSFLLTSFLFFFNFVFSELLSYFLSYFLSFLNLHGKISFFPCKFPIFFYFYNFPSFLRVFYLCAFTIIRFFFPFFFRHIYKGNGFQIEGQEMLFSLHIVVSTHRENIILICNFKLIIYIHTYFLLWSTGISVSHRWV